MYYYANDACGQWFTTRRRRRRLCGHCEERGCKGKASVAGLQLRSGEPRHRARTRICLLSWRARDVARGVGRSSNPRPPKKNWLPVLVAADPARQDESAQRTVSTSRDGELRTAGRQEAEQAGRGRTDRRRRPCQARRRRRSRHPSRLPPEPHVPFPCVWLESGVSRVGANPFPWLFGWRMRGLGWLQSGIFLSDAGWTRPSKSGRRSRSSRVGVHQTLNFFNQTPNGAAPSLILQPNTKTGWVCPQNRSANKHSFGLAPSPKTGLDPTQPTQPQPNTRLHWQASQRPSPFLFLFFINKIITMMIGSPFSSWLISLSRCVTVSCLSLARQRSADLTAGPRPEVTVTPALCQLPLLAVASALPLRCCFLKKTIFLRFLIILRSCLVGKNFQDFPSHRILYHMYEALNIDENKN